MRISYLLSFFVYTFEFLIVFAVFRKKNEDLLIGHHFQGKVPI